MFDASAVGNINFVPWGQKVELSLADPKVFFAYFLLNEDESSIGAKEKI